MHPPRVVMHPPSRFLHTPPRPMHPPSALYQNERLSNPIHKARTLAILDGFGSGLVAVLGPGEGVVEVGSGVGVVAVLAASVRNAPDATSRWTFSKRQTADLCGWPGRFKLHHEPRHPVDTHLNHVQAWH